MLPITDIESIVCTTPPTLGGLRQIKLYSMDDYDSGTIANGATAYIINFSQYTGRYEERDGRGPGGDYTEQSIEVILLRKRVSIELMRQRLRDTRVVAECLDSNGESHLIVGARLSCTYSTGSALRDRNGYTLSLTGTTLLRSYSNVRLTTAINGVDGAELGSDFSSTQVPTGDTIGLSGADYYMQVVTTQLGYVPTVTANPEAIRNRFVTASDGSRWAIDKQGNGILLQMARKLQIEPITMTTSIIDLAIPESSRTVSGGIDPVNIIVSLNGDLLQHDHPDVGGYRLQDDQLLAPLGWPFQPGDRLKVYYL